MPFPAVPPIRLILIASLLGAPAVLVLLVLAALGLVGPWPALLGIGAALAAGGLGTWLAYADLRGVADYVRRLAQAEPDSAFPLPAQDNTVAARAVNASIARLVGGWRRRHAQLARQLQANEQILDALHDPLTLIDANRRVIRANPAALDLFGKRMLDQDLAATLRNPALLGAVDAVLGGASSRTLEFALALPVERIFEARIKPFHGTAGDAEDRAPAAILTLHDITTIKRSERMRADFVANASHELRTPLATLVGFIETLRGPARDDPEARDRFLSIMQDQAGRMSRLIADLLSLSRIELDEHTPPTGEVDLPALLRRVIAGFELRAQDRCMRIVLNAPDGLPAVTGDEDQLSQVFQNLIDNALKYGREGTEVTVAATVDTPGPPGAVPAGRGARVVVAVTDRGEGIPRAHLPRLTERFYRVDAARSRALGGTGLGLAIVKHIVNRHRGRLTIESQIGVGTTFAVHLPAAIPAREPDAVIKP